MTVESNSPAKPCPAIADTHAKRLKWWMDLEPQWRAAFQYAFFQHTSHPSAEELENLWQTPVLRLVGPKAPHPNMSFELTNCSGLAGMSNLEILVLTNHRLETIGELASLPQLKSLFVNNNAIRTLEGIESLNHLEQLYAQINQIDSLAPIRNLTKLREIYISLNAVKTLDGLTRKHANALKGFYCLPNDELTDRDIMRVERNLGIRCRSI